jgi:hypothetical protein
MRPRHIHGDALIPTPTGPAYLARSFTSLPLIVGWSVRFGLGHTMLDRDAALHILWARAEGR